MVSLQLEPIDISEPVNLERDYTPAHAGHSYSIGVNPLASFPNDKLPQDGDRKAVWAAPHKEDFIEELRNAVQNADWNMLYAQGKTRSLASSSWSSSGERCDKLREICISSGAVRVLEIGSFCGVSALCMAEVLPEETGSMLSLECDPFLVDFGLDIKVKSNDFWKITYMVGPARESLKNLVERVQEKDWEPFDLVVIDADKTGVVDYFEIVADTPGFMCETSLVCVDVTPYKLASASYIKHGKPEDFVMSSGQSEINALRKCASASGAFEVSEASGMLFAQRRASGKKEDYSIGANPFAAFPNDQNNMIRTQSFLQRWVGPESAKPLLELRNAVHNEDWGALFSDGATQVRVEPFWCATPERCENLQSLCKSSGAKRVLEVGTFCGVAAMSMAEALPEDASIISLDLDPFVIDFGQEFKDKCPAWTKVSHMVGSAKESIQKLVERAKSSSDSWKPFDLVVLDADKESMLDYFRLLWESPGMLAERPVICVDTTPFKGQLYVPYVKGKLDDFIVNSGQKHIDAFHAFVKALPELEMNEASGLAVVQRRA